MGYERTFKLGATRFGPEEIKRLKAFLSSNKEKNFYCFNESTKWYDFIVDIKRMSKQFENVLFYCAYVGEDTNDNEYVIFHRGDSMPNADHFAFKLPMNEKVQIILSEIMRLEKEIAYLKSKNQDAKKEEQELEDIVDILSDERVNLIDRFFETNNLVDISDQFDLATSSSESGDLEESDGSD
jgi:hypothetical protein